MPDIRKSNSMEIPANRAKVVADLRQLADELEQANIGTSFLFITCRPLPPEEREGDKDAVMSGHVWGPNGNIITMASTVSEIAMRTLLEGVKIIRAKPRKGRKPS